MVLAKWLTPYEAQQFLAASFKRLRRSRKHSRKEAGLRTGVPDSTIRRFESTGEISLRQFLILCRAYGNLTAVEELLPKPAPQSLDELTQSESR